MQGLQFTELSVAYGGVYEKVVMMRKEKEKKMAEMKSEADKKIKIEMKQKMKKVEIKKQTGEAPEESYPPTYDESTELAFCENLEKGQKLRIVDGILKIDNRKIQCVARAFTKDSRNKTLEHLKMLCEKYRNKIVLFYAIEKLKVTYKKDEKFVEELEHLSRESLGIGLLKLFC